MNNYHTLFGERRDTYHFLSGLYLRPPTSSMLAMIQEKGSTAFFPAGDESLTSPWVDEIDKFREDLMAMADSTAEMEAEHTSLFVLPSGVLPHEAVYLDEKKRLGGKITMAVAGFYRDAAIEISDTCIEMPDHLGMELEFMARLCGLAAVFHEENDQTSLQLCLKLQQEFMNRHLGLWATQCCNEILSQARYGLYRAVAMITLSFLAAENEHLQECLEQTGKENWLWESSTV
jgi:TorA maturation chaperone TorD